MAIKRIGDVFRVETDTRRFLREIHILRHLNHPNIIRVLDAFYPGDEDTFSELYIVFEVRDTPRAAFARVHTRTCAVSMCLLIMLAVLCCCFTIYRWTGMCPH